MSFLLLIFIDFDHVNASNVLIYLRRGDPCLRDSRFQWRPPVCMLLSIITLAARNYALIYRYISSQLHRANGVKCNINWLRLIYFLESCLPSAVNTEASNFTPHSMVRQSVREMYLWYTGHFITAETKPFNWDHIIAEFNIPHKTAGCLKSFPISYCQRKHSWIPAHRKHISPLQSPTG
jgi:hypothetical protein